MKKLNYKSLIVLTTILISSLTLNSQVAINTDGSQAESGSVLDVKSFAGGILIPRLTMAQRNAISNPSESLLIYQTDNTSGFYFNSGTPSAPDWKRLQTELSTGQWSLSGTDIYYNLGNVGIGTSSPSYKLDIAGTARISTTGASSILNIDAHNSTSNIAKLIFQNTSGSGDFQIMGDGGDIVWQGGGSRNLQMGAYHGMDFMGARLTYTAIPFTGGTLNDYNSRFLNTTNAIGLIVQGSSVQTRDLQQWRNSSGTVLDVVNPSGNVGIGTSSPNSSLEVNGAMTVDKVSSTPTCSNGQTVVYVKGNNFVIMYNDYGTYKFRYLTLTGSNASWTYTTTAP